MQGIISKLMCKRSDPTADRWERNVNINNQLKSEALHSIGRYLIAGLGIGAAGRGIMGLSQLTNQNIRSEPKPVPHSIIAPIPVPDLEDEEEEEENKLRKVSNFSLFQEPRMPKPKDTSTAAYKEYDEWRPEDRRIPGHIAGDDATTNAELPFYIPAVGLGAPLAAYGGYKLVDWLLNKRNKQQQTSQIDEAKKRYHDALLAQYTPNQIQKWSSANINEGLDILFDAVSKRVEGKLEKAAHIFPSIEPAMNAVFSAIPGQALGVVGLGAGALALGAGVGTYNYVKKRDPEERLKKIIEQRRREQWLRKPPEVFATPSRISVSQPKFPSDPLNDQDNETREKVSALVSDLFS